MKFSFSIQNHFLVNRLTDSGLRRRKSPISGFDSKYNEKHLLFLVFFLSLFFFSFKATLLYLIMFIWGEYAKKENISGNE